MKKFIGKRAVVAALAAFMLLTGCSKSAPSEKPLKNDPLVKTEIDLSKVSTQKYDETKMNDGYGEFTFKMLQMTAANAQKSNIMISPASLMMALDMCAAGAKEETLKQLNDLFAKDTDPLEQQAFASDLMKRINNARKVDFACANAVWNNENVLGDKVNSSYIEYIRKTFDADFRSVKFDNNTHNVINKWVDEKTKHMIPTLFSEPFNSKTAMVLVNAIRFEAQWKNGYQDGQISKRAFDGTEGKQTVTMLSSTENGYFSTVDATGFIKYYEGEEYAFVAILPNDRNISANDFLKKFTYDDYKKFIKSRTGEEVITMMPEFKSDFTMEPAEYLKALGAKDAFDPDHANFKGIAETHPKNIYISRVIHKTHIEVDSKGTKAAAATGITLEENAAMPAEQPKEVICDRPYVYAIVDTLTMNPIFIGTVNNVE